MTLQTKPGSFIKSHGLQLCNNLHRHCIQSCILGDSKVLSSYHPRLVLLAKHLNRWIRHQEFNGRQVAIRSSLSNLSEQRIQYGGNSQTMPGKSKTPAPCSTSEVRISDTSGREEVPKVVGPTYLTQVNRNIPEMVELAIPNFQWIQYDTVQVQYIPYPRLI